VCLALYDCVEGDWASVETCDRAGSGGSGGGGSGGAGSGGQGGGACAPPDIDRTAEAERCSPDLQEPDCPVEAVFVCPDPCLTGCADFFLCTEQGWVDVAACDEDGALVVVQP
jgi:hypothetical protein